MGSETSPSPDIKTREAFIEEVVTNSEVLIHAHFMGYESLYSDNPNTGRHKWNFPDINTYLRAGLFINEHADYFFGLRNKLRKVPEGEDPRRYDSARLDTIDRSSVFELVSFVPIIKIIYGQREVIVPETGLRRFLKMTKRVIQTFVKGYRPMSVKDFAKRGGEEDVVWVGYLGNEYNNRTVLNTEPKYRDLTGRAGIEIFFNLAMPQRLANELAARLNTDPKLIRDVMEKAVETKSISSSWIKNFDIKDYWKRKVRPPFEKWEKYGTGILVYNYPFDSNEGILKPDVSLVPYTTTQ